MSASDTSPRLPQNCRQQESVQRCDNLSLFSGKLIPTQTAPAVIFTTILLNFVKSAVPPQSASVLGVLASPGNVQRAVVPVRKKENRSQMIHSHTLAVEHAELPDVIVKLSNCRGWKRSFDVKT